jgi:tRNA-2-methylthio-N6-dimethylallyladenosine synthase
VAAGFREIVYLGQTVNSYHDGAHYFADLLRATDSIEGLLRIRFTSPHPSDMSERVIAAMAECGKVAPQVHLPLQSGSDRILAAMNRTYTMAEYRDVVARLRGAIPGIAMSTDLIVGFPGETEEDFQATVAAMREFRWDSAFLFKYSARLDTKAHRWPETVGEEEKGRRLTLLIDLQNSISAEINDAMVGRTVEVLVEGNGKRDAQLFGRSADFKNVVFASDGTPPGALARVRVIGATSQTLIGEAVALAPAPEGPLLHIA